jgi:hypothetical protein
MSLPGDRDPKRGDEPPLELELADVPRRLPRGAVHGADLRTPSSTAPPPGPSTMAPAPAPAGGRNLLDEPSRWPRRIVTLLLIALLAWGAYGGYQRVFRKRIVAVSSPYKSSTGVTIDLPGRTGWYADRNARMKQSNGPTWMRGEALYRASKADQANEAAMVLRLHAPGAFARAIDPEELRRGLETALRQAAAGGGAMITNLSCALESSWRPAIGVACFGKLVLPHMEMPAGAYLWVQNDDDVVGIGYATAEGNLDQLEVMARSAR